MEGRDFTASVADGQPAAAHRNVPTSLDRLVFRRILLLLLLAALAIRLALPGSQSLADQTTFREWARASHRLGVAEAHRSLRIEYPPLLLYPLALAAAIEARLPEAARRGDYALTVLIKLAPIASDLATTALIAVAWPRRRPLALVLAASYAFNPGVVYLSAVWGQMDAVYTLFLVAALLAVQRRQPVLASVACSLALLTKLQSVAAATLLLAAAVVHSQGRRFALPAAASLAAVALVTTPWMLSGGGKEVLRVYLDSAIEPPRLVVSGYNLWYLLRLGDVRDFSYEQPLAGGPITYQQLAWTLSAVFMLKVLAVALRREQRATLEQPGGVRPALAVPAALLCIGLFVLFPRVHERYLFPALAFLSLSTPHGRAPAVAYLILSATFFFNLVTVLSPAPALWSNLSAGPPATALQWYLEAAALVAAAVNVTGLVALTWWWAVRRPVISTL